MQSIVPSQAPHFTCHPFKQITTERIVNQHLTTAYSPWENGFLERICREILRTCQTMLNEFKLAPMEWPVVTECIQSVLNHSPLIRLVMREKTSPVNKTLLEVFTSHKFVRPPLRALPVVKYRKVPSLYLIRA